VFSFIDPDQNTAAAEIRLECNAELSLLLRIERGTLVVISALGSASPIALE
jgi:hypothetical protein